MFSLQRTLGDDNRFLELLEGCALEATHSVAALKQLLERNTKPSLDAFAVARRKDKELMEELMELMLRTLVLAMEREDIDALAHALYRVPKTIEKFAERFIISVDHLQDVDFSRQLDLMERASKAVLQMIGGLKSGAPLGELKHLNATIQKIENHADDLVLEFLARLYEPNYPKLKAVIVKDLVELNEKVVDRCRDAGNVIVRVALKNN